VITRTYSYELFAKLIPLQMCCFTKYYLLLQSLNRLVSKSWILKLEVFHLSFQIAWTILSNQSFLRVQPWVMQSSTVNWCTQQSLILNKFAKDQCCH